jgi:hypothetical protein
MPREILVDWVLPSGTGHVNVWYFDTGSAVTAQRTALQAFYTSVKASLVTTCSYTIRTAGRELSNTTGGLTGAWTDATAKIGTGGSGGDPVPDATQVLWQWLTGSIADGRFLRGRTFIPCLSAGSVIGGNLNPAVRTTFIGYGTTLLAANVGQQVWHRPKKDPVTHALIRPGSVALTGSNSVWSEMAVLRRRRG